MVTARDFFRSYTLSWHTLHHIFAHGNQIHAHKLKNQKQVIMGKTSIYYIKEAAKKLINSKLQRLGAAKTQEALQGVKETVGLETKEEVLLFVAYFDRTTRGCSSDMDDIARYFECSALDMLEMVGALKSLERKGILVRCRCRETNILKQNFLVSDDVVAAVIENRPVQIVDIAVAVVKIDKYEFCKRVGTMAEDSDVVTEDLVKAVEKMEGECSHLQIVADLKKNVKDILDRVLFYVMCFDNYRQDGDGGSDINRTMNDIFTNVGQCIRVKKDIKNQQHALMKLGLIEIDYSDEDEIRLTDKSMDMYYGDDVNAFENTVKCQDIYEFVKKVNDSIHGKKYDSDHPNSDRKLREIINGFERANKHIALLEQIRKVLTDEHQRALFYCVGNDMIEDDRTSLPAEVRKIYHRKKRLMVVNQFKDEQTTLQKLGWAEVVKVSSMFGDSTCIALTDKGKEALLGEDAAIFIHESPDKNLMTCDKIQEKHLFFPKELDEQLSRLRYSLQEDNYKALCERLVEKNLPKGIAVLLYGSPGTGKTESALQIARATGRPIMKVDISETKTMWFGESEKLIKKVFDDYRKLCEKSKVKPILLFNEADGVFSKRKDVNIGSCAQTENAIQNIILEELEKIDGILFATTNLADNLDDAFERRFLFKIHFDKPSLDVKKLIWMDKIPSLTDTDALKLAASYDFSGGQIDNIVRKSILDDVISGVKPTLSSLMAMCAQEKILGTGKSKIGFC